MPNKPKLGKGQQTLSFAFSSVSQTPCFQCLTHPHVSCGASVRQPINEQPMTSHSWICFSQLKYRSLHPWTTVSIAVDTGDK